MSTQVASATSSVDFNMIDSNFFGHLEIPNETEIMNIAPNPNNILPNNLMTNPFFIGVDGGDIYKMKDKDLYTLYKRVIILCRRNNTQNTDITNIFEQILHVTDYNELADNLILVPSTIKLLKNKTHRMQSNLVDKDLLTLFNHLAIDLNDREIVIPFFGLVEHDVYLYTNIYENSNNLDLLIKLRTQLRYFNCDLNNSLISSRLSNITSGLQESEYWTFTHNCKMNLTKQFIKRVFKHTNNISYIAAKNNGVQNQQIRSIIDTFSTISNANKNSDYLQFVYSKEKYTDASVAAKDSNDFKLYRVEHKINSEQYNKEQITELFKICSNSNSNYRELYDLFNMFLMSKSLCHLVINNKDVLDIMQPIITKFLPLYKYLFGYAWLCMYMEECLIKTRINTNMRFVFDINTANKLPIFPYCSDDIHMNPYITLLISETALDSKNNFHSLGMIDGYKDYGIDTLDGFKRKFNIFTTKNSTKNIFDGLETDQQGKWLSFAVSGSVIPMCCEKRSPLLDTITNNSQSYDIRWNRYFEEYCNGSDIDVMCNKKSVFEFMDEVKKLAIVVANNLNIKTNDYCGIKIEPIKSTMIVVNTAYIKNLFDCDPEFIINNINNINSSNNIKEQIKELFFQKYVEVKIQNNRDNRKQFNPIKNNLYEHFYKLGSIDDLNISLTTLNISKLDYDYFDGESCIFLNDILPEDEAVDESQNMLIYKLSESIRFKITSPELAHTIEVFKTKYDDYFSCVSRFHLPCVRGYYDNNTVYLLPSCVTALMTHINIDYKYFAGSRDPINILNKYRMRGFGTIVNENEKKHIVEYNSTIDNNGTMFLIDGLKGDIKGDIKGDKKEDKIKEHFGIKYVNNKIFRPGQYLMNIPSDSYKVILNTKYIKTVPELYAFYKTHSKYDPETCGIDLLKFKTIDSTGHVTPFKPWVLNAAYDLLNK
jgi:hypothetical protein